jgi:integration host factor subunit alpha
MALTKERLIASIYDNVGLSKNLSRSVVERLFDIMKNTMESGEDLLISGFGKFTVRKKAARRGRNPQTSEELELKARRIVTFKASGKLKQKLNADPESESSSALPE